jgi:hypothetical protein
MKNVQVIDGAVNSVFEVYSIPDKLFYTLFPKGTDLAFVKDFVGKIKNSDNRWRALYKRRMDEKSIRGIHGSLCLDLCNINPKFFPSRRETDVICRAPFSKNSSIE